MSNSNDTMINNEATEPQPTTASEPAAVETASENVNEALSSDEAKSSTTPTPDETSDEDTLNLEFNRANIEALGSLVHLVDSDEDNNLDMFCYVKCDETDNSLIKQCRGVVFNGKDLVMKAFPYTNEYSNPDTDVIV